jgi:hypothetical protein
MLRSDFPFVLTSLSAFTFFGGSAINAVLRIKAEEGVNQISTLRFYYTLITTVKLIQKKFCRGVTLILPFDTCR